MLIKRVLILLPILIFLILLQSFFWVPTYDEQAKGNPDRLESYITASIGDAKVLNPILNADSASSTIVDQVFDGLIDRDEDLRFRGRLAERWEIFEEAYFYLNPKSKIDGRSITDPQHIKQKLLTYRSNSIALEKTLNNIQGIEVIPPTEG